MNRSRFAFSAIIFFVPFALLCFASWAYSQQDQQEQEITNSIGMKLRLVSAGSFQMGSPDSESGRYDREGPVHPVTISESFYLGGYEVTQEQYEAVMGTNPSYFKGSDRPVECVSWNDAVEFCRRLSELTGESYRLPTEAEWEYACRAGTKTKYYWGDSDSNAGSYAWYGENSRSETHPVSQKEPNTWGLYDMSGNVREWCSDWYSEDYYENSPETDPKGPSSGQSRVLRCGGWQINSKYLRSALRHGHFQALRLNFLGFRVVRDVE